LEKRDRMAKWDLLIKNGKITTAEEMYEGNMYVKDGKIAAITLEELSGDVSEVIDAKGCHVLPGLMDTHIHSRDPGATYKEDFYHSTLAAAAGGVTLVFEMPNTNPPINNQENLEKQVDNLSEKANVDFGIWGICLGDLNNDSLYSLYEAGVIGFKFFWGYAINKENYQLVYNFSPEMDNIIPPLDDGEVFKIFREVEKTSKMLAIHAENNELIHTLTQEMQDAGRTDYHALVEGRPDLAELTTIQTGIAFAKHTGARLHILHITSEAGVDAVKEAQGQGANITSETCPQFLFLSADDYADIGPMMKVYPPVKEQSDQNRIWEGIHDGTVSIVCSDHAPHTEEEKDGDIWSIPSGMCGVETIVPLMLDAVSSGKIDVHQVVSLLSTNPAKQFDLYPRKGSLQVGTDADITIVDMEKSFHIDKNSLQSKSKVTAYDGWSGVGSPVATIVQGNIVMKDGQIIQENKGKWIKPEK